MTFECAILNAKYGKKIYRKKWRSKKKYISSHNENLILNKPFLYMRDGYGNAFPWLPNHEDIFANDWRLKDD